MIADEIQTKESLPRPRQMNNVWIGANELRGILGIPNDHRIVRLELTPSEAEPGVLVMIEGPGCQMYGTRSPIYMVGLKDLLNQIALCRDDAIKEYGPYSWTADG